MWRLYKFWHLREDLRLLWFALRHGQRPGWLVPAVIGLLIYALDPFNFAIPFLGVVDELVVVPFALHLILKMLPFPIRAGFAVGPGTSASPRR